MPAPFQLLGSHPALDLVNTLDERFAAQGPKELLPTYTDLLAFVEQSDVLEARQVRDLRRKDTTPPAARALRRAHELREALASTFYGIANKSHPPPRPLHVLERALKAAQSHRELVWDRLEGSQGERQRLTWNWVVSAAGLDLPAWAVAQSAVELLTSDALSQVRECSSPTCRWLFLDSSKNHTRRWCDMAICGNRMKARRFQARQHLV